MAFESYSEEYSLKAVVWQQVLSLGKKDFLEEQDRRWMR